MAKKKDLTAEAAETERIFAQGQADVQALADQMESDLEGLDDDKRLQYFEDMSKLSE